MMKLQPRETLVSVAHAPRTIALLLGILAAAGPVLAAPAAPGPGGTASSDTVEFLNGDRVTGMVLAITARGKMSFQPAAADEPLLVDLARVKDIVFAVRPSQPSEKAPDSVLLTARNGLSGTILSLDRDVLVLRTVYADSITIPRQALRAVAFQVVSEVPEVPEADTLVLANGDKMTGNMLSMEQGAVRFETVYGIFAPERDAIFLALFGREDMERPRHGRHDVVVEMQNGDRMTIVFGSLNGVSLRGTFRGHECIIDRSQVKRVWMNIYGPCCLPGVKLPEGTPERIRKLVEMLGAGSYRAREKATRALTDTGKEAEPALEAACFHPDPEVRMRAGEIIESIHWYVEPELKKRIWPAFRDYKSQDEKGRKKTIDLIVKQEAGESIPVLVAIMEYDLSEQVRRHAYTRVRGLRLWDKIIGECERREVEGLWSLRLMCEHYRKDIKKNAAKLLSAYRKILAVKKDDVDSVLGLGVVYCTQRKFNEALRELGPRDKALGSDARYLSLVAVAYAGLEKKEEKARLERRVHELKLGEGTLYRDATFLQESGFTAYAIALWKKIIEVPPQASVYDSNAHIRLAGIFEERHSFAAAAHHYQRGLEVAVAGGFGIVGGTNEGLKAKAREMELWAIAESSVNVTVSFKQGTAEDYRHMKAQMRRKDRSVSLNVQPDGFRLFEEAGASVRFDAESGMLGVYLNDTPAGNPARLPFDEGEDEATILINQLDMAYFYSVKKSGECRLLKKFERDYVVKTDLTPLTELFKDISVSHGETHYAIEQLAGKGIALDWFPEKLTIHMEMKDPKGRGYKAEISMMRTDLVDH